MQVQDFQEQWGSPERPPVFPLDWKKTSLRWQNFFPIKSLQITSLPEKNSWDVRHYLSCNSWCPSLPLWAVAKGYHIGAWVHYLTMKTLIASQEGFQQKNDSFNTWTHVSSTTGWLEAISEKCEIKSCRHFLRSLFTSFRKGGFKSWGSYNAF